MDDQTAPAPGSGTDSPADAFRDVPVTLVVSVGRARTSIGTLLSLDRNAVIPLDKGVDDPVTIYAGDRVVARGELQEARAPQHRRTDRRAGLQHGFDALGVDAVGISRCPDWAWYSHDATGAAIDPPHDGRRLASY